MKTKIVPLEEAKATLKKLPERKQGQWNDLFAEIAKSGKAVEVSDITVGQMAALQRKCKAEGFTGRRLEKGTKFLVVPPEKKA